MSAAEAQFKQEMPPKGGYNPINFKRVPAKTFFNGWTLFGGYMAVTSVAAYLFYLNCKAINHRELEMRCANLAIYPMLLAERDRMVLRQLRKNRDEEDDLMKNVEGWKTGTWYGEPVFRTVPQDTLIIPQYHEYYVHSSYKDFIKKPNVTFWS